MKISNSILSKELGLPLKKVLKILNLLTHAGLITRIVSKEGTQIELTEKAKVLLSSTSQALIEKVNIFFDRIMHILSRYFI